MADFFQLVIAGLATGAIYALAARLRPLLDTSDGARW